MSDPVKSTPSDAGGTEGEEEVEIGQTKGSLPQNQRLDSCIS